MKPSFIFALFIAFTAFSIHAQTPGETRVPLSEPASAIDTNGSEALLGRLRTTDLKGSVDSPVTNILIVLENRSAFTYSYVSGRALFYDSGGVRCGEGLFKVDSLASGESAETDTPGLRLRCAPATWRIVATNLLMPNSDTAGPSQPEISPDTANASNSVMAIPQLEINIDGEILPLQLGNPIEINTRRKRKVHIVVNVRP